MKSTESPDLQVYVMNDRSPEGERSVPRPQAEALRPKRSPSPTRDAARVRRVRARHRQRAVSLAERFRNFVGELRRQNPPPHFDAALHALERGAEKTLGGLLEHGLNAAFLTRLEGIIEEMTRTEEAPPAADAKIAAVEEKSPCDRPSIACNIRDEEWLF